MNFIPITGPFDWIMTILIIWAVDILTPPYPTSEIIFIIIAKIFKLPAVFGEIFGIVFALVIVFISSLIYGDVVYTSILYGINYVLATPWLLGVSILLIIGSVAYFYWDLKS